MASFKDLPAEVLSLVAGDPVLTNHDRKQARLACRFLAVLMTPYIFRRAYISWIQADRDSFLSLAATPQLAAHVEEVVWFEMDCCWFDFHTLSRDLQGLTDLRADLLTAAQGLCWPPFARPLERFEYHRNSSNPFSIETWDPFEYVENFSLEFKAALTLMPKVHTFSSEPMPSGRIVSTHPDSYPFHIGLMKTRTEHYKGFFGPNVLNLFLETINEERGRITRLRCAEEALSSLGLGPRGLYAAFRYLTSFDYSISAVVPFPEPFASRSRFIQSLQDALFQASRLQELSIAWDCGAEVMRTRKHKAITKLFLEPSGEVHKWEHLRSLKLGYVDPKPDSTPFLPVIAAHVGSLRHLHLEQCRPARSFARELFQLRGLQLISITISNSEVPKSKLISERELLRFIHQGDTEDPTLAVQIANGKFTTHNRRTEDYIDDKPFEDDETDSDHSSEWWSDSDSDLEL